ncbi:hypothetical protein THAOC_20857, partial [Thalassiosira oceanica]
TTSKDNKAKGRKDTHGSSLARSGIALFFTEDRHSPCTMPSSKVDDWSSSSEDGGDDDFDDFELDEQDSAEFHSICDPTRSFSDLRSALEFDESNFGFDLLYDSSRLSFHVFARHLQRNHPQELSLIPSFGGQLLLQLPRPRGCGCR